ncbi:uncharacterized protein LOC122000552 [Zingiber officinale]|uniref:uncharacterized protein LOC122000552 n=1 Tax=Zingiber officinale TaxID=94328 RepID=UPI001C4D15A9|nr:uncharacterized protein LOC122000552 [Zingiber officinale]
MATRPSLLLITLAVLFLSSPLDVFASRSNLGAKRMTTSTEAEAMAATKSRTGSFKKVQVMEGDEEESRRFRSVVNSAAAPGSAESSSARQVPTGPDPIHHHGGPPLGRRRRRSLQLEQ